MFESIEFQNGYRDAQSDFTTTGVQRPMPGHAYGGICHTHAQYVNGYDFGWMDAKEDAPVLN